MELFQNIISFFSCFISKNCRENTQFEILFYLGEPVNKWSLTHRQRRMEGGIRLPKVDSDTSFCRSLQCRYCYVKLLEKEIIFGQKVFIVEKKECLIYCSIQENQRINGRLHTYRDSAEQKAGSNCLQWTQILAFALWRLFPVKQHMLSRKYIV